MKIITKEIKLYKKLIYKQFWQNPKFRAQLPGSKIDKEKGKSLVVCWILFVFETDRTDLCFSSILSLVQSIQMKTKRWRTKDDWFPNNLFEWWGMGINQKKTPEWREYRRKGLLFIFCGAYCVHGTLISMEIEVEILFYELGTGFVIMLK